MHLEYSLARDVFRLADAPFRGEVCLLSYANGVAPGNLYTDSR